MSENEKNIEVKENATEQELTDNELSLRMNTSKVYTDFSKAKRDYSKITLENAKTLTSYVDSLLFKAHTLEQIFEKIEAAKAQKFTSSRDFKNLSILKKHIKYRQEHDKLQVNISTKNKLRYVDLHVTN